MIFFFLSVFEIWKFGAPSLGIYQSMKITSSWSLQVRDPWNLLDSLHFYFWHIPLRSLRIGEKGGKMKISNALPGIFGCFWKIEAPYIFWETRVVETFPSQNSIAHHHFHLLFPMFKGEFGGKRAKPSKMPLGCPRKLVKGYFKWVLTPIYPTYK